MTRSWIPITVTDAQRTDRLEVPGGWLVRSIYQPQLMYPGLGPIGHSPAPTMAMVFVPGSGPWQEEATGCDDGADGDPPEIPDGSEAECDDGNACTGNDCDGNPASNLTATPATPSNDAAVAATVSPSDLTNCDDGDPCTDNDGDDERK